MEVYFDNSSTTRVMDEVVDYTAQIMRESYGNPSSRHSKGLQAEKILKKARLSISSALKAKEEEIIFTSGGTEANNLAIFGACEARKRIGNGVITSKVEHASVLNTMAELEKMGFEVTYLDVDENGNVDPQKLKAAINEKTIFVSIMHVNNEIGNVNNIELLGEIIKEKNKDTLFHVDAVQSFGKIKINLNKIKVDLMSISSHKVNGPKGVGALYCRKGIKLMPILYGGGHEMGLRPGTENVPGIGGFGLAVEMREKEIDNLYLQCSEIKKYFINRLETLPQTFVNGDIENQLPYLLNISFLGVRSEVLLHALERDGIYVSSGSACSSKKQKYSHVLEAMKLLETRVESAIRFSFGVHNTKEEVDYCIEVLKRNLDLLRKFKRR